MGNDESKKPVNIGVSLLTIQAMLETCINMQAQIIAKLENREQGEVFKNAMKSSSEILGELFAGLPK